MNIASASIKYTVVVLFICLLIALGGISAYFNIEKLEDPAFTIKTVVVSIIYPGSTIYEAEQEAASKMERCAYNRHFLYTLYKSLDMECIMQAVEKIVQAHS